jgi:adenosylmethionine-8-amino-7-oxononanoate aminotransferase
VHPLAKLDHKYVWHPFTQMRDWLRTEPIVIAKGRGAVLEDVRGRKYLDANSSIWTNLHGHNHPQINAAIARQLRKFLIRRRSAWRMNPASSLGAAADRYSESPAPAQALKSFLFRRRLDGDGGRAQARV